jgi:acetyltransferase-like isoleucine patch superfamily enzyme
LFDLSTVASVGKDVFVDSWVNITRPHLVSIGSHTAIDWGFHCTVAATIGDYVHIGPFVTAIGGAEGRLTLGHFAAVAAGVRLICGGDEHAGYGLVGPTIPERFQDRLILAPITLEPMASVLTNAVIMPGVTVSIGSVVGAGSIVTKTTRPWTMYLGSPARPVKERPRERMLAHAAELGYEID